NNFFAATRRLALSLFWISTKFTVLYKPFELPLPLGEGTECFLSSVLLLSKANSYCIESMINREIATLRGSLLPSNFAACKQLQSSSSLKNFDDVSAKRTTCWF